MYACDVHFSTCLALASCMDGFSFCVYGRVWLSMASCGMLAIILQTHRICCLFAVSSVD
jgi:hypothetical protein